MTLPLRKLAFARIRKAAKQRLGDNEAQHRVTEKLKLLIIVCIWHFAGLVGQAGAVSESANQQARIFETVAELFLQSGY